MLPHPKLSRAVAAVGGSVYSAFAQRVLAHRQEGGEVFPFHVGDTWLSPAEGCRLEDVRSAELPGLNQYAPVGGLPALVDALVARQRERTGVATERDQVLVTGGATAGLAAAVGAVVEPGDEVLILAPYWPLIAGIVRCFHATPVPVPFLGLADSPETAVELVKEKRTPRTVALYLNTPNNPSGRVIPRGRLEALVAWAAREGLWILSDDVYEDYGFEAVHTYCRSLAPERVVAAHSFSKAYGMAGYRCGYLAGPREVIEAATKVSTHTVYSTPTAAQHAALRVLGAAGDAWVASAHARYREIGAAAARRLGAPEPEGSTFLFLDVNEHLGERGLHGFLEDCADRGLLLAPGPSFGPYPTHVRLCYTAAPPEVTARGVEVLAGLLGR